MLTPFVSIIIPLYNKQHSIRETVNSVLSQTYKNFEVLIVNDGSTDNSLQIVKEFDDDRIKLFTQDNHGISYTRNRGIKEASGEWILFLDADDCLLPNGLTILVSNIVDDKTIIAGNFIINDNGVEKKCLKSNSEAHYSPHNIYKHLLIHKIYLRAGSFIVPREFVTFHQFNERLSRYEDMEMLINCYDHLYLKYVPELIMRYDLKYAEASRPDKDKWVRDFGFYLKFERGNFWKNCLLGGILNDTIWAYPDKVGRLREIYKQFYKFRYLSRIINICLKIKQKLQ